MILKVKIVIILISTVVLLSSCGKAVIDAENGSYEPKIVIDGILFPHKKVDKIRIARNFPIDANLQQMSLLPDPRTTLVILTDMENDRTYTLKFHVPADNLFDNYYWEYNRDDLIIEYGHSYALDVRTIIDGLTLEAHAETTVPQKGLEIVDVNHRNLQYREKDTSGETQNFELTIERSPQTTFYLSTVTALNPSIHNYVYDNSFVDLEPDEVQDDLVDFTYSENYFQDFPSDAGLSNIDIFWFNLWFYDEYQIVVFAADRNYKEFLQTYNGVQEDDGNFHEPVFHIEGDGIGLFGSVVADTAFVTVSKNNL